MHDFLLAKEIVDELERIIRERKLGRVKKVQLEIGRVALAHDGHPEHTEEISVDNLKFGLENIAKGTLLGKAQFNIIKVTGDNWKITEIEV